MSPAYYFAPFERALRTPFIYGGNAISIRKGYLISRGDPSLGQLAEASPLSSHSRDTFEQVGAALTGKGLRTPALEFALSSFEFCSLGSIPVRSNALIQARGNRLEAVAGAQEAGYTHCKLKIERKGLEEIPKLMAAFPKMKFRLDANRSLDASTLGTLLSLLEKDGSIGQLDYIEEPYVEFWNSSEFSGAVPFAADESASSIFEAERLLDCRNPPQVFIVKPTVYGSLTKISALMSAFRLKNIRVVITSALEVEAGRRSLLRFLSQQSHEVAGLSTGNLFSENYLEDKADLKSIPDASEAERKWIASLQWREVRQ